MKNLMFIPELPKGNKPFNIAIKYASSYLKKGHKKIEIQQIKNIKTALNLLKFYTRLMGFFQNSKTAKTL